MEFVWFLLIAVISGLLAGMGMGGGTLLIPAITILMGIEQEIAQSTNLLVFVPCAIVCIIIYDMQYCLVWFQPYKFVLRAPHASIDEEKLFFQKILHGLLF